VGIGGIRLGMSLADVVDVLGRPTLVNRRRDYGFGSRYIEYDWGYARWTVGFAGRGNALRVVKIGTTVRAERTPKRVGIGSLVRELLRAYPRAGCTSRWYSDPDPGTWVYIGREGRITAFHVRYNINYEPDRLGRVSEILVQRRWIVDSGRSCGPEWKTR
jgi:hypothetical protein